MDHLVGRHDEARSGRVSAREPGVVHVVSEPDRDARRQRSQQPDRRLRRTLPDILGVNLAPFHERAIVVRRRDAERSPGKLPARAAKRRDRERQLPVGATEERAHLRARAEQIEVDIAQTGERQRHRDVRIEDDADRERPDAVGTPRDLGLRLHRAFAGGAAALQIAIALGRVTQHHVFRRDRALAPGGEIGRVDLVSGHREHAVNRGPIRRPFVRLPHIGTREQPYTRLDLLEIVRLLRGDDRAAQMRLRSRNPHHRETVHRDPRAAAKQAMRSPPGSNCDDVAGSAGDRLASGELVAVNVRQGDRQRRRRHSLRLDDRQPRHAAALELDPVHPDRTLFEFGDPAARIQCRLRGDRDRRREPRRLERHRERSARDQVPDHGRLARRGSLVAREDFLRRSAIGPRSPGRPRQTDPRRFAPAPGR